MLRSERGGSRDGRDAGRVVAGLSCADVAAALPAVVDGDQPDRRVAAHVDACLRCQAELAGYRRLLRTLHALRTEVLEPPDGAVSGVLARVAEVSERRAGRALLSGHRAAYVGTVAAATAAVGAGAAVVVLTRRRRRAA